MRISIIVAVSDNQVIGRDNRLLWHLPNDMKFFKNTTWGMPVIMGRKTYASLGKPLVGRTNIVITRNSDWKQEGVLTAGSLEESFQQAAATDALEVFVIGGGEIYQQVLPLVQRIYLTRVHTQVEGDTFFPDIRPPEWSLLSQLDFEADDKHAYPYSFQVWSRNP